MEKIALNVYRVIAIVYFIFLSTGDMIELFLENSYTFESINVDYAERLGLAMLCERVITLGLFISVLWVEQKRLMWRMFSAIAVIILLFSIIIIHLAIKSYYTPENALFITQSSDVICKWFLPHNLLYINELVVCILPMAYGAIRTLMLNNICKS